MPPSTTHRILWSNTRIVNNTSNTRAINQLGHALETYIVSVVVILSLQQLWSHYHFRKGCGLLVCAGRKYLRLWLLWLCIL